MDALQLIERFVEAGIPAEHAIVAAKIALNEAPATNANVPAALRSEILRIAAQTGVRVEEIMGRGRTPRVVLARQEAFSVARDLGLTLPQIARAFDRDHTTIRQGIAAFDERRGSPANASAPEDREIAA